MGRHGNYKSLEEFRTAAIAEFDDMGDDIQKELDRLKSIHMGIERVGTIVRV